MATYGAPREIEETVSKSKGKDLRNGCIGCFGLFVMLSVLGSIFFSCVSKLGGDQMPQALKDCEEQVKSGLPLPESYKPLGTGVKKFTPIISPLENEELSEWQFTFEANKPDTVLGQASDNPLRVGTALCTIDKKTNKSIGKLMLIK